MEKFPVVIKDLYGSGSPFLFSPTELTEAGHSQSFPFQSWTEG
jgi:hypothetical protein